jgi:hypothetical protein
VDEHGRATLDGDPLTAGAASDLLTETIARRKAQTVAKKAA